jgi:nitrate/nitrite transporter NarK
VFLPIQTVAGVFRAFMFVPGLMLVVTWFPANRRATAMGIYAVGGFLGNVVLSVAGPALAGVYGWRMPFLLFSSIGVAVSIAYLLLSKENPAVRRGESIDVKGMLALFRYRTMWLAGGIQYVRLAVVFGLRFWIPSFLADEHGVSLPLIGAIIAVSGAITAPANLLGGYVSDRLRNPPLVIGGSLLVLAIAIALLATVDNLAVLVVLIFITSLFQQLYFGPLFAAPVEILGLRSGGVNLGFSNSFANFGALTFGYGIGALKDITGGFDTGFYALVGCCLLGLVLTVLLDRARRVAQVSGQLDTVLPPA